MSEIKKENNNDLMRQLLAYKNAQLAELNTAIMREKSRAAVIMASVKSKKEALSAKAEEQSVQITPVEINEPLAEKIDATPISDAVEAPQAEKRDDKEIKPELKTETVTADAPVEPSNDDIKPTNTEAAPKSKEKSEKVEVKSNKPEKAKPVQTTESENKKEEKREEKATETAKDEPAKAPDAPQPEILPNGEIRRIYVPPAPKPKVQTRVFGQGGYVPPNRGPRPQGGPNPNYRGQNPNYQGQNGRPMNGQSGGFNPANRGPRPGMPGGMGVLPPFAAPKTTPQKNKNAKPNTNTGAKFDDRGSLNKRALMKKGYIVDETRAVEDYDLAGFKTRNYKVGKNRGGGNSATIIIERAEISTDPVSIKVLSEKIGMTSTEIVKTLFLLGIIKTINENVDFATAELVAAEFGITLEYKPDVTFEETLNAKLNVNDEDDLSKLKQRPPIVTIMGHVDHGKTSLLDYIRKTNVTGGEAGGITQHIGAYTVSLKGLPITFLDTPGHEAFTSMRARGAQVTDIAVLVVAADDGIMPQTIEAINHAKQADVPIIVALNKMDKPGANPDNVLKQLADHSIIPEEWGGDTPVVRVSAKTGFGIENLLENILTLAEIKELRANPDRAARGTIIEARLDKGLGKIATVLVQTGTLRVGDNIVAGVCTGKIRAMIDDKGKNVKKAGPSIPVSVTGWDEIPDAGDLIDVVSDEKFARELAEERKLKLASKQTDTSSVSLNDLFDKISKGELKSVKLIIKADVQGSVEAVKQSLAKLGNEEVTIDIIHGAVGAVKESDVLLAETAQAIIIGFNVRADAKARALAAQKNIDIRFYDIIYNAIEDIEKAVKGLLEPKYEEVILGTAEVRELFRITGVGVIAGSHVTDGKIVRGAKARLIRDGKVEYTGEIASLRHAKDDVKEMAKNFDCGIMLQNYQDVKQGDVIEAFQMTEQSDEN